MRLSRVLRDASPSAVADAKKKIQIAVVGSGPSGCYVADFLTRNNPLIHVDVFEKLPVPFGLSRYGVAPDHPEVKNVEIKFKEMFKSSRASWIGNIDIGRDIPIETLRAHYTAVVVATGAYGERSLGIPGETLGNVISARHFVNYYNTYPYPHGSPQFCPFELDRKLSDVVIIGNGNVSLDVARVLGTSYKHWCPTDMNAVAIRELMNNRIRRISICGRRGVEHGAFAIAEFRELLKHDPERLLVSVEPFDLEKAMSNVPVGSERPKKRLLELLSKHTIRPEVVVPEKLSPKDRGPCSIHFGYHLKPLEFVPHPQRVNMVGAVRFEKVSGSMPPEVVTIPCQVAFKSLGSSIEPLRGVSFNAKEGHIDHQEGRVAEQPGVYCAGWAKHGAKGVILHAMMDAQTTATTVLNDLANGRIELKDEHDGKYGLLDMFVTKKLYPISTTALERIWFVERERAIDLGKAGEKINNIQQFLEVAMGGKVGKRANNQIRGLANARPDAMLYLGELLDDDTDLSSLASDIARSQKSLKPS